MVLSGPQRTMKMRATSDIFWVAAGERRSSYSDRKSTRLNSSHLVNSYAVFCLKKKSLEGAVTSTGPLSTAWRIAAIGDLNTVTTTRIVDDMAPPSRIADTSWIKPDPVAWSWLTDPASPGDENRQKQYVDFAQQNGWPYVLVDAGWQATWVPDLVAYAHARNVGILLWYDSSNLQTATQRQQLQTARNWGVVGVKIDFVFGHSQSVLKWVATVLAQTASLHLMVNFHGTEMTRGMQRTWPHVMTSEAVFGAEQQRDNAAFDTILPYTRNAVSSMDFTPVEDRKSVV